MRFKKSTGKHNIEVQYGILKKKLVANTRYVCTYVQQLLITMLLFLSISLPIYV